MMSGILAKWRRRDEERGDRGAALMLALGVLFVASTVTIALVTWIGNSLSDTVKFQNASYLEYTTGAAAQTEIQNLRYAYMGTSNLTTWNCTPGGAGARAYSTTDTATYTMNNTTVKVWCSMVYNFHTSATRVYTMSVCDSSVSSTNCVASPYLQAVVQFNDYSISDVNGCNQQYNQTTCGEAMQVTTWVVG